MTTPDTVTTEAGWVADASRFGARLALIRQRMGWGNIEKAARECGIPVETWRSWERDNREPQRLTTIAMTIASRTGCDYLWLCHGPGRGGSTGPTTGFATAARVIAVVGETVDSRGSRTHDSHPTRPVRQTRPLRSAARRSITPVSA